MELKEGYKQTEFGMIPNDWDVFILNDLTLKVGSGITPTGGSSIYKDHGRPFIRSQNIGWGKLLLDDIAFIDDETHQTFQSTEIYLDDVFLNISGASIGRSSYANTHLVGGNVNQHVCIIRVNYEKLVPAYLNLFLLSKNGQKQIDSFQSGGNRQGLNIGQIKKFKIPSPTIAEQKEIAAALININALIIKLEKLIEKKQAIKQGAMQKLLKPKEGWITMKLGKIFLITAGGDLDKNNYSSFKDNKYRYPIYSNSLIDKGLYGYSPIYTQEKNTITVTARGTVGQANSRDHNYNAIGRVIVLKPIQELDCFFLAEYINNKVAFANESTGVPQLTAPQISKYEVIIPQYIKQLEIVEILRDMDSDINILAQNMTKYKMIKQGMMQELLTGKIRLI